MNIKEILSNLNIQELNEMQKASLKMNREESEVLLLSPTGSGKTLAFLLPLLEKLDAESEHVQAIIIVPVRELAIQIEQVFNSIKSEFSIVAFYGGQYMKTDINKLSKLPSVVVGTPGRLIDHIDRETFTTESIKILVLDEFDKSLEMGFHDEMSYIVRKLESINHKMFTSATQSVRIPEFVQTTTLKKLNFDKDSFESKLQLKLVQSEEKDKLKCVGDLLRTIGDHQSILFSNHRESSERIVNYLKEEGFYAELFHGGMDQKDRELAMNKFKNKSTNVLVATDLAARGLDIPEIEHVIHYHLPLKHEEFIHRNGRTARMEASGSAYIVQYKEEQLPKYIKLDEVHDFEVYLNADIPKAPSFTTIFVGGGKKSKINKIDIVGFLSKKGGLTRDELGVVIVKENVSYAAISSFKVDSLLKKISSEKIKGKKVKFGYA